MDLLESLIKKFNDAYGQKIADLNSSMYVREKNSDNTYSAPVITIGKGGGYVKKPGVAPALPAKVEVQIQNQPAFEIEYRLALPRYELEIADKNSAYFKFFFDTVVSRALSNYKTTVGGPEELRYGTHYIKSTLSYPNENAEGLRDGSDFIILTLSGSWAKAE